MPAIITEKVELAVADGSRMGAYVARPNDGEVHPGVIVFQEAFGVNSHIRNLTERLSGEGFVAIAPELFHRTAPGFAGDYKNFPATMPHIQAMTAATMEADCQAAFDWLRGRAEVKKDAISSVGFCLGGRVSFIANSILPLKTAVSFYGGRIAPDLLPRAASLHAPMLFFWGGLDKHITPELRRSVIDALAAQGKTYVNVEFSNADHGFFCDERATYQPQAARQAWPLLLDFLRGA